MNNAAATNLILIGFLMISTILLGDDAGAPKTGDTQANTADGKEAVVRFLKLKTIAEGKARHGEHRIGAILKMGELELTNAMDYLLENITLQIPKTDFRSNDDRRKQRPCFYALQRKGKAAIPDILRFLQGSRDYPQLVQIAFLLERISGLGRSRLILLQQGGASVRRSGSRTERENIETVLSILSQLSQVSQGQN